jgi:uroporphyrin-III C-methyltransferase
MLCAEYRGVTMVYGKVWLVGAGPGDPELLTLKAVKIIADANVILVDDLVSEDVLSHASATARIIPVGKRGGCRSTPQVLIERLMLREARAGNNVVRLKGGDPCMFGRAGEEQSRLQAVGIEVEIVSGVTSGIAGPASCGIPVTHRDVAPGVIFVTGHTRDKGEPNWASLAKTGLTLVIYMGFSRLPHIAAALIAGGLASTTPVAVIARATTDNAAAWRLNLWQLIDGNLPDSLSSPSIIVVGDVVNYGTLPIEKAFENSIDVRIAI